MIRLSKKADYGIEALIALSKAENGELISMSKMSKERKLPLYFLSQVMSELKKAGLVESKEGIGGGYRILVQPEGISILRILEIFEGETALVDCACKDFQSCKRGDKCQSKEGWSALNKDFINFFKEKTLQDLIKD